MTRTASRWPRLATAAMAGALVLTLASCARDTVPTPRDDATPEQVVRAYADAVHAGHCDTAQALVNEPDQSWCGDTDITALTVTGTTQEPKATESGDGPMIQRVWVNLTPRGGDETLQDGELMWSYLLDRTGPNGAWRIYDQGMG